MGVIRKDQHEALRDALLAAYPRLEDLQELTAYGLGFKFDAEVRTGGQTGTRTLIRELIEWVDARGPVDALFDAALERRPDNEKLREFAATIGRASARSTGRALQKESFDLEDLERHCSDLLEGQLSPGLRVLLLAGVEPEVFECFIARLRPLVHRGLNGALPDTDVPLDMRVANIDKAIDRVKSQLANTERSHVLVKVNAAKADSTTLEKFIRAVRAGLPVPLAHDLVLLVHAAAELAPPLPDGLADLQLPRPAFAAKHLYAWVERVSVGQGWSEALKTEFKLALEAIACLDQDPSAGDFYYAVTQAIRHLCGNPDESAIRAWIAEQRAQ